MIDDLRFVQGAIAKKDIVPALSHFRIHNGRIKGYNGKIAICSPIELGIDCQPKATEFIKAIQSCDSTVHLNLTPAGRLTVKSGAFKAHIGCIAEDFPDVEPEGMTVQLPGGLLPALKMLEPMIAEDASRPWARGILFRGAFAHATNNVVICQYWLGYDFPFDLVIPHDAVNELLRVGLEPVSMQMTESSVTFHFEGNRWLRTQSASTKWPDIGRILDKEGVVPNDLPPDFFDKLDILRPFIDELSRVYFVSGAMATHIDEGIGAKIEHDPAYIGHFPTEGCFNLNQFRLLAKVAKQFDFNHSPALFFGDSLRGAIMPMRFQ